MLQADGLGVAPNASATKVAHLLDEVDPDRTRDLCVGTVDTWIAWHLSEGALHVTDATNAGVTGLRRGDGTDWDDRMLAALRIDRASLPTVVDTSGVVGAATALDGAPRIAALVGDQQASLVGQGGVSPRPGEDHLRHRRDARPAPRRGAAALRPAGDRRLLPDHRVASRRRHRLGRGGRDAVGGHQRGVVARRPGIDRHVR